MTDTDNIVRLAAQKIDASEDALALLFAERHAADLRFVPLWNRWLSWTGAVWQHDDVLAAFDRARAICRELGKRSAKTVAAVVTLARSDQRIVATAAQWDTDPRAINTPGGILDLRTGEISPNDPARYFTKITAVAPAPPGTPCPLWTTFLDRVTAESEDLSGFLQRFVGYCLTGLTTEDVFAFLYGTGANGKSTFVRTVSDMLDTYSTGAVMEMFLETRTEQHPAAEAKLVGARLVTAHETQEGRRWNEAKIKKLTGGDKSEARFMRQDWFDYDPTFKIIILGNHKPRLQSLSEAMRRRFLLIPFDVRIPIAEQDPELTEKLKAEWPAILRWAIDGAVQWHHDRLDVPPIILKATADYFLEQDTLGEWIDEALDLNVERAWISTADLFFAWRQWCEIRNLRPGTEKAFSEALKDKGFEKKRERTGRQGFATIAFKSGC